MTGFTLHRWSVKAQAHCKTICLRRILCLSLTFSLYLSLLSLSLSLCISLSSLSHHHNHHWWGLAFTATVRLPFPPTLPLPPTGPLLLMNSGGSQSAFAVHDILEGFSAAVLMKWSDLWASLVLSWFSRQRCHNMCQTHFFFSLTAFREQALSDVTLYLSFSLSLPASFFQFHSSTVK